MTPLYRLLLLGTSCLVAGCASMPLGTMWKLSRMGPEALIEANPVDIRAAARSDRWFLDGPGFDSGTLEVALRTAENEDREWRFLLQETSGAESWQLDPPSPEQRWRIYRIAPDDLQSFQLLQREMPALIEAAKAGTGANEFSLSVKFGAQQQEADPVPVASNPVTCTDSAAFRVDLQLDAAAGFFTLLREHVIEVEIHAEDVETGSGPDRARSAELAQGLYSRCRATSGS